MFEVLFYEDKHGNQPIKDFLAELREQLITSKTARIQYSSIIAHIEALERGGTRIGKPKVKHIGGNLWELRPLAHRIFFFYWKEDKFVLLHHFVKKTQKTPTNEIERARRNMQDYIERKKKDDKNSKQQQ